MDQFGDFLNQLGFLNLIRDFRDDDLPLTTPEVLDLPFTAQTERPASRGIGICDTVARLNDHAAGREIRARNIIEQRVIARIRRLDQMDTGIHQLCDIMRRNIGRHTHRNPRRAIGQKAWELCRQNNRLGQTTIIVIAEINRVFVQTLQHRLSDKGHARFGVSRGRRVVAVDIAEVPLTIHQRVAHRKILRQTRHRVIDRSIPVRVEIPHRVARDFRGLQELAIGRQLEPVHRIENASMHRFQTIARVRKGAVHNGGQSIGQIAFTDCPV